MENSTKALLIAASVLIVIVLISVGIKLLGSTKDVTNQVDSVSESMATSVFNSQFSSYFSNSTSGTQAKALITKVMSNNANASSSNRFSPEKHQVYINLKKANGNYVISGDTGHRWKTSQLQELFLAISDTKNYSIQATTGCTREGAIGGYYNGYIICITIRELR